MYLSSVFRKLPALAMLPYFYRPQTKFAKVMFLQVSVILSTGGACVVGPGGRVWLLRGVRGCSGGGCAWLLWGAYVVAPGGHAAWLLRGSMRGCSGGACVVAPGGGMRGCSGGRAWFF